MATAKNGKNTKKNAPKPRTQKTQSKSQKSDNGRITLQKDSFMQ